MSVSQRSKHGPARSGPALIERYVKGEAWIELRLGIRSYGNTEQYIAVIECLPERNIHLLSASPGEDIVAVDSQCERGDTPDGAEAKRDDLVLVDPIKFVDDPDKFQFRPTASVIRLKVIDATDGLRIDVREPSGDLLPELRATAVDREHGLTIDRRSGESPGEMIEGAAETVDTVTDGETKIERRRHLYAEAEFIVRLLSIKLFDDAVRLAVGEVTADQTLDFFEMLIRPLDLSESGFQSVHDVELMHGQEMENAEGRGNLSCHERRVPEESEEARHDQGVSSEEPPEEART